MFRVFVVGAGLGLCVALSACAPRGVDAETALHDAFEVPVSYQTSYQRARNQFERCLRGDSGHAVQGRVDASGRSAQVSVQAPFTRSPLARVDLRALDGERTRVAVALWGINVWNGAALVALRDAMTLGITGCRSYMPVGRDTDRGVLRAGGGDARR